MILGRNNWTKEQLNTLDNLDFELRRLQQLFAGFVQTPEDIAAAIAAHTVSIDNVTDAELASAVSVHNVDPSAHPHTHPGDSRTTVILGEQGEPGEQGEIGISGQQGIQGIQGIPGVQGDDGEPGDTGFPGIAGNDGAAGAPGPIGPPGLDGADGLDGDIGPPGQSIQGPTGPTGDPGPTGPALFFLAEDGIEGDRGPPGPTGAAGAGGGGGGSATTVEVDLGSTAKTNSKFTITDAAITPTSKILSWQAPGPYTGKGTRADEAEMQPVQVIAVEPASGSAVVKWQTPFSLTHKRLPRMSGGPLPAAAQGQKDSQGIVDGSVLHLGKVRGNVKFNYVVFS